MGYTAEDAKYLLVEKVEKVVGYIPDGLEDLLNILSAPDVRSETAEYMRKVMEEV